MVIKGKRNRSKWYSSYFNKFKSYAVLKTKE